MRLLTRSLSQMEGVRGEEVEDIGAPGYSDLGKFFHLPTSFSAKTLEFSLKAAYFRPTQGGQPLRARCSLSSVG